MTWDTELEELVRHHWRVGQEFSLDDVYRHEAHFARLFPQNHHRLESCAKRCNTCATKALSGSLTTRVATGACSSPSTATTRSSRHTASHPEIP